MKLSYTSPKRQLIGCWLLATAVLLPTAPAQAQVPARAATEFISSVGVGTHWGYSDTPYGMAYPQVLQLLTSSGIRHVRDGGRLADMTAAGIGSTFYADVPNFADGNAATVQALLIDLKAKLATGARIDAVEGPNEPDLFWRQAPNGFQKSYLGQGWQQGPAGIASGTIAFMQAVYAALKADPVTRSIPVIGPSLGVTYDPGGGLPNILAAGSLTNFVDYGNFHPYPGGNPFSFPAPYAGLNNYFWFGTQPSGNLDEWPAAFTTYRPPFGSKPIMATETGYATEVGGTPESVHAKYIPRLFLEYFRLGVTRTYLYEFVDEFANQPSNREAHFGLLRYDLTPKPAYTALRSLLGLLQDPTAAGGFTPQSLAYTVAVAPPAGYNRTQYVRHVLLQKQDGTFYLVLYHEIANSDNSTTPQTIRTHPAMPTTVTLPAGIRQVTAYTYDAGYNFQAAPVALANHQFTVDVQDQVMVLALSAQAPLSAAGGTRAPAGGFYPNPVAGRLTVADAPAGTRVRLADLLGRSVLAAELGAGGTLDVGALPAGAYWLTVDADGPAARTYRVLKAAP